MSIKAILMLVVLAIMALLSSEGLAHGRQLSEAEAEEKEMGQLVYDGESGGSRHLLYEDDDGEDMPRYYVDDDDDDRPDTKLEQCSTKLKKTGTKLAQCSTKLTTCSWQLEHTCGLLAEYERPSYCLL